MLAKTGNYPISGGIITVQTDSNITRLRTNTGGIVNFKGVACGRPVRLTLKSEDGSQAFTRSIKCGAGAAWSYQTDCFVPGKNGGCAIEQVR